MGEVAAMASLFDTMHDTHRSVRFFAAMRR
jgi:hypothetical protein